PVEYAVEHLRRDTAARIGDDHDGHVAPKGEGELDGVLGARVLDGVLDQRVQRELKAIEVRVDGRLVHLPEGPPSRGRGPSTDGFDDQWLQVLLGPAVEAGLPG